MNKLIALCSLFIFLVSCQEDEKFIDKINVPSNLKLVSTVAADGSGQVNFEASASDVLNYHFYFGNSDTEEAVVSQSGRINYTYRKTGVNNYKVKVIAYGIGGVESIAFEEIEVRVDFKVSLSIIKFLTNNSSKNWYWKKQVRGHLGVGPLTDNNGNTSSTPSFYTAAPNEKQNEGCLYDDVITFTDKGNGLYGFRLQNNGNTFFHNEEILDALGVPNPGQDACYDFDAGAEREVTLSPISSGVNPSTGISMELGNKGFMSYFLNSSTYEIMSITDEELVVRVIQDIGGNELAWYQIFTSVQEAPLTAVVDPNYTNLVWADEFTENSLAKWNFDTGSGGWGNQELQYYTDRADNAFIAGGFLNIKAKKEAFGGAEYTSARLKTQGKFDFTYGKIEMRAKLPEGKGTWPAFWTLGSNFPVVGWPACGEVDIMEHVGNDQNTIHNTLHTPSSSGNSINTFKKKIEGVSSQFHVYAAIWSENQISFYIDGDRVYTYKPAIKNANTWPYVQDQFIILNCAMGGTFGGAIDSAFKESVYQIDYVRVYK
jgi:hypothetical protein